jgi:hypothetical protein
MKNMKSISAAVVAVCSLACVTLANHAEAGGAKGNRADLPCPYGGAGSPNPALWDPTSGSSPYNPGLSTPFTATLVGGPEALALGDQSGLTVTSAIQYVYYASPIPDPTLCDTDPSVSSDGPLAQVLNYTTAVNPSVSDAGDVEIEFNYNTTTNPAIALTLENTVGTASFTAGGVTYQSSGTLLPTGTDNDFLFSSTGVLLGEIVTDSGTAVLVPGVPQGWSIKTSGGGGSGGAMAAPEIDPSSSIAGITLLAGLLAVSRGGRRTLKVSQ